MYAYEAKLERWIDGDTLILEIDLGFYVKRIERIRLARINTPEMNSDVKREVLRAKHAKMIGKKFCPEGSIVEIQTFKMKKDMYARYIAEVTFEGKNLSDYLLETGVAEVF